MIPWSEFRTRVLHPFGNPWFKGQPRTTIYSNQPRTPVYSNPTIATDDLDAWLPLNQRSHKTMAQVSPSFLTAEVCENGHVTTSAVERYPAHSAKFCPRCGAATLRSCPKCEAAIRGQEAVPVITNAFYQPPNHCHACGAEFPWKIAKLQAAKEHAAELEGLDEHERQQLPGIIDDLSSGGPRTELAAGRFKRLMQKVGPAVGGSLQRIVVDLASEAAKKLLLGL